MPFSCRIGAVLARSAGLALVAGLVLVRGAHAQDAPDPATDRPSEARTSDAPAVRRVGVVLLPRGGASPEMTDSLTELLIAAIAARGPSEIVGKEEFQAALGRDDAGTLACIESGACLGRMGRELRVRELVAGTLHLDAAQPERFRFDLYRLDVESGAVRGRVSREIDGGLSALLAALTSSVDELYVERVEPGAVVVEIRPEGASVAIDGEPIVSDEAGALRRGFLVPGTHRLTARAAGHEPLARDVEIAPGTTLMLSLVLAPRVEELSLSAQTWALAGLGAALGIAAAAVGASSQAAPDRDLLMRESQAFYDAREVEALTANVLFAVGGAALVATLVSLVVDLTSGDDDDDERALADGGMLRW